MLPLKGAIIEKICQAVSAGTNSTFLAPDAAKALPTDESVNDALRQLIIIAKKSKALSLK